MLVKNNDGVNWYPDFVGEKAIRQLARKSERLGDLEKPLLGHAAVRSGYVIYHEQLPRSVPGESFAERAIEDIDENIRSRTVPMSTTFT